MVCVCNMVFEKEILTALKKGAGSTEDIQYLTRAGTSCGKCVMTIDRIVDEYEMNAVINPQRKLDL